MDIRQVDVHDATALRAWHASRGLVHEHDRPDAPFWSFEEAATQLGAEDPEERYEILSADVDGEVAGTAIVYVPLLDNLDKAYFELEVAPGHRGRGVGDALAARVVELGEREGRKVLIGMAHTPSDADETQPVHRFAARHGFAVGNVEIRRTLELPVADVQLRAWADEAAPHHEGYEIATYADIVPAELRPSFVDLQNQLAVDAPTGAIDFEPGAMTVEIYEEHVRTRRAAGRRLLVTVAVREGQAVAHSTLSVPPGRDSMPHVQQWGTYVHREHRGHRLGLAVKAANLRAVQERFPERTLLSTTNSPANRPMLAINDMMGFRPVEASVEFVRTL